MMNWKICGYISDDIFSFNLTIFLFLFPGNGYLLVSSVLYIHRLSFDGARTKALHSSSDPIRAVDYDYG